MSNIFPIDWENKENSPALLAYLQQFGEKSYFPAEEINQTKNALNWLYNNFGGGSGVTNNTGFAPSGENYVFNNLFGWKFNGVDYSLTGALTIPVPYAADGFHRIDLIVADNGNLIRIPGPEVLSNVSAAEPVYNAITQLRITAIPVNDDSYGTATPPSTPNIFVKKQWANVYEYNGTGTNKIIPLPANGHSEIRLINAALTSVSGVDLSAMSGGAMSDVLFQGKPIIFWNRSGHDLVFKNQDYDNADLPFFFRNETDAIVLNNQLVYFHYDNGGLQEMFRSFYRVEDIIGLQDALDLKADITYVHSLVVGLWNDRGSYNASSNTFPSTGGSGTSGAIKKGDIWTISASGTLPSSQVVEIGDTVRALVDSPGTTASNWTILQNNIGYVPENTVNKVTTITGNESSNVLFASVKAVVDWVIAGFVPKTRTLTIGGVTQDLSADRTFAGGVSKQYIRGYYPSWADYTTNLWVTWPNNTSNMLASAPSMGSGSGSVPTWGDSNFLVINDATKLTKLTLCMNRSYISKNYEIIVQSFDCPSGTGSGVETNIQTLIQETLSTGVSGVYDNKNNFTIATHTLNAKSGIRVAWRYIGGGAAYQLLGVQLIFEFE